MTSSQPSHASRPFPLPGFVAAAILAASSITLVPAAEPAAAVKAPSVKSPVLLPGKGLAEHDFFYAGEAKQERMFIVRGGKVAWSYEHNGRGEISDAVLESNGAILFAHQFGITEI